MWVSLVRKTSLGDHKDHCGPTKDRLILRLRERIVPPVSHVKVSDVPSACIVVAAATIANLAESYLGASVQGRVPWLTNDLVNMLQISLAAAIAILARLAMQGPA